MNVAADLWSNELSARQRADDDVRDYQKSRRKRGISSSITSGNVGLTSMKQIGVHGTFDQDLDKFIAEYERDVRPLRLRREKIHRKRRREEARIKHNADVSARTPPGPDVLSALSDKGLLVARITNPKKSFVIGSSSVVKLTYPGRAHLGVPSVEARNADSARRCNIARRKNLSRGDGGRFHQTILEALMKRSFWTVSSLLAAHRIWSHPFQNDLGAGHSAGPAT